MRRGQSTLEYVIIIAAIIAAIILGANVMKGGVNGMFQKANTIMGSNN